MTNKKMPPNHSAQGGEVRRLVRNGGQENSCLPLEVIGQRLNVIDARIRRYALGDLGKRGIWNACFFGNGPDLTLRVIKLPQHEIKDWFIHVSHSNPNLDSME